MTLDLTFIRTAFAVAFALFLALAPAWPWWRTGANTVPERLSAIGVAMLSGIAQPMFPRAALGCAYGAGCLILTSLALLAGAGAYHLWYRRR